MLGCVAVCLLVFASAVSDLSSKNGHSKWAAWLIGFMALPAAGIGVFAYPHPLHNVFRHFRNNWISGASGHGFHLETAILGPKILVAISSILFVRYLASDRFEFEPDRFPAVWGHVKPVHGSGAAGAVRGVVRLVCHRGFVVVSPK